jgi:peptidoglycan/xylan/chitin deacetylase (PgdA/CDA1 family)
MQFGMTVDDVCMSDFSSEVNLTRFLDLFKELAIRATFFVVPLADGIPLSNRPGYVDLLKRALDEGHEVAQHGLEHDRFEVGIPPPMVLDLPHEGPARERLARDRDLIDASHSVSRIRELLVRGRGLLEDALGVPMIGFRAPCLQVCDNLFTALADEGYRYDSSFPIQEAGWDLIMGNVDIPRRPITRERFEQTKQDPRLISLPMTTDYTWYLTEDRYDATVAMARQDVLDCLSQGVPFVPLSHVTPLWEGDGDCGARLFRDLVAFARNAASEAGDTCDFVPLAEVKI